MTVNIKGVEIEICDCHKTLLDSYEWSVHKSGDSYRVGCSLTLHRMVAKAKPGEVVDHIDGNPLNNRCDNLRICTKAENNFNKGMRSDNTSGYKGVYWNKLMNKWASVIQYRGVSYKLGFYDNILDAAQAYDTKAKELHGEYARTNEDITKGVTYG